MVNVSEVKQFVIKYGKKWLFPDFTNKLTWLVAGTGATLLITPVALEQLLYNWLVETVNLNAGVPIAFAELEIGFADYWVGFGLIFLSLAHNIANRYFIYMDGLSSKEAKDRLIQVDRELFSKFKNDLSPDSRTVRFLRDVDLGGTYHDDDTRVLDRFCQTWNATDREFHDEELEILRKAFLDKSKSFLWKLANNSYDIGGSRYRCVPDPYVGDFNYPPEVDKTLCELNDMATELYNMHSELVRKARTTLSC
ncbi:hypothetical protein GCM10009092_28550 [Bowmanella denitrificans]|uniref:Ryanodine receptor Ryr domain-containing protein n=1 Tax=Bowmanella denitrificans TaxID=366582 RepID=A0ABN0XFS0_9ALTE